MSTLETILYLVIQGLAVGSLYGMIALGVVLIYKTSEVLNFAHGNMGMVAAFVCLVLMEKHMPGISNFLVGFFSGIELLSGLGSGFYFILSFVLVLIITFLFAFLLGLAIEFFTLRPAKDPTQLGLIVITIGLWLVLDGAAAWIFGTQDHRFPEPMASFKIYKLGKIPISQLDLIVLAITVILITTLFLFFRFSRVGIAMRATSQKEAAAKLMGIKTRRVFALTWGMGSVLGAIAGVLATPKFFLNNTMMLFPFLKAFAAATLGGLVSLPGAIVGGWILGVTENLFGRYVSMELKTSFAFLVIILVLSIRPSGLLAKHFVKKV
jgi:branched-chain amino acid transport system permease protein